MTYEFFCHACREYFTEHPDRVEEARSAGVPVWCPRCYAEGYMYDTGTNAWTLQVRDLERIRAIEEGC